MRFALLLIAGLAWGQSCSQVTAGWDWVNGSRFNGFRWFPNSKIRQKIDTASVSPNNLAWISDWQAGGSFLWFGPGLKSGSAWLADSGSSNNNYNVELHVVDGATQPRVNVRCGGMAVPDGEVAPQCYEHDPSGVPIPMPPNPRIQHKCGAPGEGCSKYNTVGDKHLIIFDKSTCVYYGLWNAWIDAQGKPHATSISIFDALGGDLQRPYSWTSDSVAGIPWFAGALRWEEVASGDIGHALAMTGLGGGGAYHSTYADTSWASHTQGSGAGTVPFGARMRLKASFDINAYTTNATLRTILKAMKEYGVYLVDGGGPDLIVEQSENWDWGAMNKITAEWGLFSPTNMEIVQEGSVVQYTGAGTTWPTGTPPAFTSFTVNGTAGNVTISKGQSVTLAWTTTGTDSTVNDLALVDYKGVVRGAASGSTTVTPVRTTTYRVCVTNRYGQTASVPRTVTVMP